MFGASCRVLEHAGVGPFPVLPFCGDAYFRDLGEVGHSSCTEKYGTNDAR